MIGIRTNSLLFESPANVVDPSSNHILFKLNQKSGGSLLYHFGILLIAGSYPESTYRASISR